MDLFANGVNSPGSSSCFSSQSVSVTRSLGIGDEVESVFVFALMSVGSTITFSGHSSPPVDDRMSQFR